MPDVNRSMMDYLKGKKKNTTAKPTQYGGLTRKTPNGYKPLTYLQAAQQQAKTSKPASGARAPVTFNPRAVDQPQPPRPNLDFRGGQVNTQIYYEPETNTFNTGKRGNPIYFDNQGNVTIAPTAKPWMFDETLKNQWEQTVYWERVQTQMKQPDYQATPFKVGVVKPSQPLYIDRARKFFTTTPTPEPLYLLPDGGFSVEQVPGAKPFIVTEQMVGNLGALLGLVDAPMGASEREQELRTQAQSFVTGGEEGNGTYIHAVEEAEYDAWVEDERKRLETEVKDPIQRAYMLNGLIARAQQLKREGTTFFVTGADGKIVPTSRTEEPTSIMTGLFSGVDAVTTKHLQYLATWARFNPIFNALKKAVELVPAAVNYGWDKTYHGPKALEKAGLSEEEFLKKNRESWEATAEETANDWLALFHRDTPRAVGLMTQVIMGERSMLAALPEMITEWGRLGPTDSDPYGEYLDFLGVDPNERMSRAERIAEVNQSLKARQQKALADAQAYRSEAYALRERVMMGAGQAGDMEKAYELIAQAQEAERLDPLRPDVGYAFTWETTPERFDLYKNALVEAELQAGKPLTDFQKRGMRDLFVEAGTEMVGETVTDWTNLLDGLGLFEGMTKIGVKGFKEIWKVSPMAAGVSKLAATKMGKFFGNLSVGQWLAKQAVRAEALTHGFAAANVFETLASRAHTSAGLVGAVDRVAALYEKDPVAAHTNLLNSLGMRQSLEIRRLAELIPLSEWGNLASRAHAKVEAEALERAVKMVRDNAALYENRIKTIVADKLAALGGNGDVTKLTNDAMAEIAADLAKQYSSNPQAVAMVMADTFRRHFIDSQRIWKGKAVESVGEGGEVVLNFDRGDILNDTFIGFLAKHNPNLKNADWFRNLAEGSYKVTNTLMDVWFTLVLPARFGWVAINYVDTAFRFLLYGGGGAHSILDLLGMTEPAIIAELGGQLPPQLAQNMAKAAAADPDNPAFRRIFLGDRQAPGLLAWGSFFKYRYGKHVGEVEALGGKSFKNFLRQLATAPRKLGYGVRASIDATADLNSALEFSFRLRLFHRYFTDNYARLADKALADNLVGVPEEWKPIASILWKISGSNPEKLIDATRRNGGWAANSMMVPTSVVAFLKGMSPEDQRLFGQSVLAEIKALVDLGAREGRKPTPDELTALFDNILVRFHENQEAQIAAVAAMADDIDDVANPGSMDEAIERVQGILDDTDAPDHLPDDEAVDAMRRVTLGEDITDDEIRQVLLENGIESVEGKTPREQLRDLINRGTPQPRPAQPVPGVEGVANNVDEANEGAILRAEIDRRLDAENTLTEETKAAIRNSDGYRSSHLDVTNNTYKNLPVDQREFANRSLEIFNNVRAQLRNWAVRYDRYTRKGRGAKDANDAAWALFDRLQLRMANAYGDYARELFDGAVAGRLDDAPLSLRQVLERLGVTMEFDDTGKLISVDTHLTRPDGNVLPPQTGKNELAMWRDYWGINSKMGTDAALFELPVNPYRYKTDNISKNLAKLPEPHRPVHVADVLNDPDLRKMRLSSNVDQEKYAREIAYRMFGFRTPNNKNVNNLLWASIRKYMRVGPDAWPEDLKSSKSLREFMVRAGSDAEDIIVEALNARAEATHGKMLNLMVQSLQDDYHKQLVALGMSDQDARLQLALWADIADRWGGRHHTDGQLWWFTQIALYGGDDLPSNSILYFTEDGQVKQFNPLATRLSEQISEVLDGAKLADDIQAGKVLGVTSQRLEEVGLWDWLQSAGTITRKQLMDKLEQAASKRLDTGTWLDLQLALEKRAGTLFLENGRAILKGFTTSATLLDFVHETGHVLMADLDNSEWQIVSTWLHTTANITISAEEFKRLHLRRAYDSALLSPAENELYKVAQEAFANGYVKWFAEGLDMAQDIHGVFAKISARIKSLFDQFIRGTALDVDLSDDMRRVYHRLHDAAPLKGETVGHYDLPSLRWQQGKGTHFVAQEGSNQYELLQENGAWTLKVNGKTKPDWAGLTEPQAMRLIDGYRATQGVTASEFKQWEYGQSLDDVLNKLPGVLTGRARFVRNLENAGLPLNPAQIETYQAVMDARAKAYAHATGTNIDAYYEMNWGVFGYRDTKHTAPKGLPGIAQRSYDWGAFREHTRTDDLKKMGFIDAFGKGIDLSQGFNWRVDSHFTFLTNLLGPGQKIEMMDYMDTIADFLDQSGSVRVAYVQVDPMTTHLELQVAHPLTRQQIEAIVDGIARNDTLYGDIRVEWFQNGRWEGEIIQADVDDLEAALFKANRRAQAHGLAQSAFGSGVTEPEIPVGYDNYWQNFNNWFGLSKVTTPEGKAKVVYHGTTHDFTTFGLVNPVGEGSSLNYFGPGHYFTDSTADVNANYSGNGADLRGHIEDYADDLRENDADLWDFIDDLTEILKLKDYQIEELMDEGKLDWDSMVGYMGENDTLSMAVARKRLMSNAGTVMPVYLKIDNPMNFGTVDETFFDLVVEYDEESEEVIGETGKLVDFINTLRRQVDDYGDEYLSEAADRFLGDLYTKGLDYDGMTATQLMREFQGTDLAIRLSEFILEDNPGAASMLTDTFVEMGFDGIAMNAEKAFPYMPDTAGATHYIVFRPEQIKSVHNIGTFSPHMRDVLHAAKGPQIYGEMWFDPAQATAIVQFYKGANFSTALHESAHAFLGEMFTLAGTDPITAQDMNALERWVGMEPGKLAEAHQNFIRTGKAAPEYVEAQEKFARAFERYLYDGNAPDPSLTGLFQRLKDFMLDVYRTLIGSPIEGEVTPEMKSVFDHLLSVEARNQADVVAVPVKVAKEGKLPKAPRTRKGKGNVPMTDAEFEAKGRQNLINFGYSEDEADKIIAEQKARAAASTTPQPYQVTLAEYTQNSMNKVSGQGARKNAELAKLLHKGYVKGALERGLPVPPEVLADYPDLVAAADEAVKAEAKWVQTGLLQTASQMIEDSTDDGIEKILVAVHNTSTENLNFIMTELGGKMPAPSIAVTRKDLPFTQFGGVTLVGRRSMIDPEVDPRHYVFETDAYTPRVPRMARDSVSMDALDNSELGKVIKIMESGKFPLYLPVNPRIKWELLTDGANSAMASAKNDYALRYVYAVRKGMPDNLAERLERKQWGGNFSHELNNFFLLNSQEISHLMKALPKDPTLSSLSEETRELYRRGVQWAVGARASNLTFQFTEGGLPSKQIGDLVEEDIQHYFGTPEAAARTMQSIWSDFLDGDDTLFMQARQMVNSWINLHDDVKNFYAWLEDLYKPFMTTARQFRSKSGDFVEFNSDNLLAEMVANGVRGQEDTGLTFGKLRAYSAKQFKSVKEMKDRLGILKPSDEQEEYYSAAIRPLIESILTEFDRFNVYMNHDKLRAVMARYFELSHGKAESELDQLLEDAFHYVEPMVTQIDSQDYADILASTRKLIGTILESPSDYYEAKPARVVDMTEWVGVVFNRSEQDVDPSLVQQLKDRGLVVRFVSGVTKSERWQAVSELFQFPDVLFQGMDHQAVFGYALGDVIDYRGKRYVVTARSGEYLGVNELLGGVQRPAGSIKVTDRGISKVGTNSFTRQGMGHELRGAMEHLDKLERTHAYLMEQIEYYKMLAIDDPTYERMVDDLTRRARESEKQLSELRNVVSYYTLSGQKFTPEMGEAMADKLAEMSGLFNFSLPGQLPLTTSVEGNILQDVDRWLNAQVIGDPIYRNPEAINAAWDTYVAYKGLRNLQGVDLSSPKAFLNSLEANYGLSAVQHPAKQSFVTDLQAIAEDVRTGLWPYMEQQENLRASGLFQDAAQNPPPPVSDYQLPSGLRSYLKAKRGATEQMTASIQALNEWRDFLVKSLDDPNAWFMNSDPAFWDWAESWGIKAAKDKQELINAATYGGTYRGQAVEGAMNRTNHIMLDYTDYKHWENLFKFLYPFWMFPTRSIPFWIETMAMHPEILTFYTRYQSASRRQRIQAGAVNSQGEPLASLEGYIPLPGTDIWINPTAPLSFRYVFPLLSNDYGEGDYNETPTEWVLRYVYEMGRDRGFSFSPIVMGLMQAVGMRADLFPRSSLVPAENLVPPWMQRYLLSKLRQVTFPSLPDTWSPQVSWQDYLIERHALSAALEQMRSAKTEKEQWAIANALRNMLDEVDENNQPIKRADNPLWQQYRQEVEETQYYTTLVGYFTGVYGKNNTDADMELLQLRNDINLLRESINDQVKAELFGLYINPQEREESLKNLMYNTPEGAIYSLYQVIRYVEAPDGTPARGEERRNMVVDRLAADNVAASYYDRKANLRVELEERLAGIPIGTPYERRSAVYDWYFGELEKLEMEGMVADAIRPWTPYNKPAATLTDRATDMWYFMLKGTKPAWDGDKKSYTQYKQEMEAWRADLPEIAKTLQLKVFNEWYAKSRHDADAKARDARSYTLDPSWVSKEVIDKLTASTSKENYDAWERSRDTAYDALTAAWEATYWNSYWEAIGDLGGQERTQAEVLWTQSHPQAPTFEELLTWVRATYNPDQFTEAQLREVYEGGEPLTIEERQVSDVPDADQEKYKLIQQMFDLLAWAKPGNQTGDLWDTYVTLGGDESDLDILYKSNGATAAWASDADLRTAFDRLTQAARMIGVKYPTPAQMAERVQVVKINDALKKELARLYGSDIFDLIGRYARMSYSDRRAFRQEYPGDYERIQSYYDFRDNFAQANKLWAAYYYREQADGSSGSGSGSSGSAGRARGGGGGSYGGYSDGSGYNQETRYGNTMGYRSTLDASYLLGTTLGKGGATSFATWPQAMWDFIGPIATQSVQAALSSGQPIPDATKAYVEALLKSNPELAAQWQVLTNS